MAAVIPPPPTGVPLNSHQWQEWFRKIYTGIIKPPGGSVPWTSIDFTGSNLTSILTRTHNSLQIIQGGVAGEYNHLTNAEYARVQREVAIATKTTTYTVTLTDCTLIGDATSAAFTFTLPTAASATGLRYVFKKKDASANAVTVKGNGAQLIDGVNTQVLAAQYDHIEIISDGTVWWII